MSEVTKSEAAAWIDLINQRDEAIAKARTWRRRASDMETEKMRLREALRVSEADTQRADADALARARYLRGKIEAVQRLIDGEGWGDDTVDDWWREQLRAALGDTPDE